MRRDNRFRGHVHHNPTDLVLCAVANERFAPLATPQVTLIDPVSSGLTNLTINTSLSLAGQDGRGVRIHVPSSVFHAYKDYTVTAIIVGLFSTTATNGSNPEPVPVRAILAQPYRSSP